MLAESRTQLDDATVPRRRTVIARVIESPDESHLVVLGSVRRRDSERAPADTGGDEVCGAELAS
jgi:hypothetical protein